MNDKFYVVLTLYFLDGTTAKQVVPIVDAIALDRALKNGDPLPNDQIRDLLYETLRELPDDGTA